MSYNVLAQALLESHSYLYTKCEMKHLQWEFRAESLYKEITNLSPDILCLQEVQATHLSSFYSKFEKIGYFVAFKKKTGDTLIDGCAICFKRSVFKLCEDVYNVEFYQPKVKVLDRHHVGIIVKLTPLSLPHAPIVVATTHLLYNPRREDVRLAQIKLFLAEIDRVAYFSNDRESGYLPIILTGDFNSKPNTPVIELLDVGWTRQVWNFDMWKKIGITDNCQHFSVCLNRLEGRPTDFSELKIQNSEYSAGLNGSFEASGVQGAGAAGWASGASRAREAADSQGSSASKLHVGLFGGMFNSGIVSHSLKLTSVYKKSNEVWQENVTATLDRWILVDYIYYSSGSGLKPLERLRLLSPKECEVMGQLPNAEFGSDHLALAAVFEFIPNKRS